MTDISRIIDHHKVKILLFISLTLSLTIPPFYAYAEDPASDYGGGTMKHIARRNLDNWNEPFCYNCHTLEYPLPPEPFEKLPSQLVKETIAFEMRPGLKRLTCDPGRDVGAFFNPKGDKIVWVTDRFGNWTIWVMNEDGSEKRQLTSESVISGWPSWSPDGQEITYWSWDPSTISCDIWKMRIDGSSKIQLTKDGSYKGQPVWSPIGDKIGYTANMTGAVEAYIIDLVGNNIQQITSGHTEALNGVWVENRVTWNPDGKRMYFMEATFPLPTGFFLKIPGDIATVDIFVVDLETGYIEDLTPKLHDYAFSVSPDGKKVATISFRSPNYGMWIMNDDGTNQTRLTWDGKGDRSPCISPSDKKILYWSLAHGLQGDIWLCNLDGSNKTRLTESLFNDVQPTWSPDESKILFESDRAGNFDIWLLSLDNTIEVDVDLEGCLTKGSTGRAILTVKPLININKILRLQEVGLRFDWNNENDYIENLIPVPYNLFDQNEVYQTEIEFSVPEDAKLGYHFYDVKVQYSEADGSLKTYEHSAEDLIVGTLEQRRCEELYSELSADLERLNDKAESEGYFEYLLKPENEYFTKACDEYNVAKSLMIEGDYDTAKYHLERVKDFLNKQGPSVGIERISFSWEILAMLLSVAIAITALFLVLRPKSSARTR